MDELRKKITEYKRKYYLNKLIRNILISLLLVILYWGISSAGTFGLNLNGTVRAILFFVSIVLILAVFSVGIAYPLWQIIGKGRQVSDEQIASDIGKYFPEIEDKLLNTIQLSIQNAQANSLVAASIDKRIQSLKVIPFAQAIDLKVNWKYARILIAVLIVFAVSSLSYPKIFIEGTERIINYQKEYTLPIPFEFTVNKTLRAFRNEDFILDITLTGSSIPENGYIYFNGRRNKLAQLGNGVFRYTFYKPLADANFSLEAAGYRSKTYTLEVVNRPEISSLQVHLKYPAHTRLEEETKLNAGNLYVPEGTQATWTIQAENSDKVKIMFSTDTLLAEEQKPFFKVSKNLFKDGTYEIRSENEYSENKDLLSYNLEIIKDQFPKLEANFYMDTILFEYIVVAGRVQDDYGIRALSLSLNVNGNKKEIPLQITNNNASQGFYKKIVIDSLGGSVLKSLEAYLEATDNDLINQFKTTRSETYRFQVSDESDLREKLESKSRDNQRDIESTIEDAKDINKKIEELESRLKSKKQVEWQEEKLLEEILKQRQKLEEEIDKLKSDFQQLNERENKFNDRSEKLQKKAEEIQKLMSEILDEETRALYEELEKLLEEKSSSEEIQDLLEDLSPNELDLEQELERTLELFKRLKVESKLEQATEDLKELAEEQQALAQETLDKSNDLDSIAADQGDINEEFDRIKEELDEVQDLNQELKNPEPLQDLSEDQESIDESLENAQEELNRKQRKKGSQQQQESGEQMKALSQKLENMQAGMEMEMVQENIDDLRDIVDNLVKLSFREEQLIKDFREVRQVDPRFVELSQEQLKLKEDAQVIQDSLIALAERVVQISNFITREVSEMNRNIDAALSELRDRDRSKALSNQQFAMTSINNLSLLLSDVLRQMQQAMASQSGKGKPNEKSGQSISKLNQLQKQLSEQIKQLQESGVKGRKLSEQLAKLAAQQEMIRNQLKEFEKQLKGQPGKKEAGDKLGEIMDNMEQNEIDLVNKRITKELIERQKEIETRMLDAEDALKDQDFEEKRKAESAKEYERRKPEVFEEYLQEKEKELELLKKVPLELSPFYKKELNDYFRRISTEAK